MIELLILLNVFFVSFKDKPAKSAPALSPRAIEQRAKWHIPLDESDYPVEKTYLDSLRRYGATIHHTSRWFNGATCTIEEDKDVEQIAQLPFVTTVEMTRDNSPRGSFYARRKQPAMAEDDVRAPQQPLELLSDRQLALYNLLPLHEAGYHGQGILITVCDGGFTDANTLSHFRQKQELGHFDFTDDSDDFYGETGLHGTYCLGFISGLTDEYRGAATQADYYLMRSEEAEKESPKEMDNLVAALEAADSVGTNVFSVSLGYFLFDNDEWSLDYSCLDGQTTRPTRAATIAARKGMLVCVAAGNEGNDTWHWINTPADADSILTVGAVDINGTIGAFSSYGPSYDGRVKPDVCAAGVQATTLNLSGKTTRGNGTSFATPLIAGLAATLWSALPNENAMQIRERIIRSANRYGNPDRNQYGYGIPDAYAAYLGRTSTTTTPSVTSRPVKYMQGNNLYIRQNGKTYTILGMSKP
ncbi:MAG: S8 family serine peptidase [Paludibacteraceae bacterium]|nr:S8 family serine peptidase [Paludibacteraceae bacterium]